MQAYHNDQPTPTPMKIWVTKYALTIGIQELETEIDPCCPTLAKVKGYLGWFHGSRHEWHRTREAAVARAEAMRQAKIKSVRKQLCRLEAMKF